MTGLKSGAGDDLWGDEEEEEPTDADAPVDESEERPPTDTNSEADHEEEAASGRSDDTGQSRSQRTSSPSDSQERSYVVRRAIQDKSVQFERDERLTFFVHDDVVEGERELLSEAEAALGRDVPKFDVREAVYRAALRNREDVVEELLAMGYTLDEE